MGAETILHFEYKDRGKKKLAQYLKQLAKSYALVGLPGANSPQAVDHEGKAVGMTVAQVGVINEFGSPANKIPSRPFMRQTSQEHSKFLSKFIKDQLILITRGRSTPRKALGLIGNWYEGRVKFQIRHGNYRPNSPYTIALKKSSRPLIDTGQMRNSVTHIVKIGGV